jgi:hypothetical protein
MMVSIYATLWLETYEVHTLTRQSLVCGRVAVVYSFFIPISEIPTLLGKKKLDVVKVVGVDGVDVHLEHFD